MAKTNPTQTAAKAVPEGHIKARVLITGSYGACNSVAALPEAVAKVAQDSGEVDTSEAAVAYAESLAAESGAAEVIA